MNHQYDCLVIGAGLAGSVAARELAERGGKRVLVLERRNHVGGNAYDCFDEAGVLIHQYGPHIFHTNSTRVFDYLSRFTRWRPYDTSRTDTSLIFLFSFTARAANAPAACPICITIGCKRVVPLIILETDIDFSATIKPSTSFGIRVPKGNPYEGTG